MNIMRAIPLRADMNTKEKKRMVRAVMIALMRSKEKSCDGSFLIS